MSLAKPQADPSPLDLGFHPVVQPAPRRFTKGQIEQFNRDGYIAGVTLLEDDPLHQARAFFDRAKLELTAPGKFQSFHHTLPELYDLVTHPPLAEHLRDLLGPDVVCFVSQYVCKEPGDLREVVWHQDASYNPVDAKSVIVWLAIHNATIDNGCMWFIPGSHRAGLIRYQDTPGNQVAFGGNKVADVESLGQKVPIELRAGQAVFFSDLLLHGSGGNKTADRPRGGFTMTFTGAAVKPHNDPRFNVTNRDAVLCCGKDARGYWVNNPRPTARPNPQTR